MKILKRIIKMRSFVVHLMYPDMAILSVKTSIVKLSATLFSVMLCGLCGLLAVVRTFYRYSTTLLWFPTSNIFLLIYKHGFLHNVSPIINIARSTFQVVFSVIFSSNSAQKPVDEIISRSKWKAKQN